MLYQNGPALPMVYRFCARKPVTEFQALSNLERVMFSRRDIHTYNECLARLGWGHDSIPLLATVLLPEKMFRRSL
jgi:hypothetical protein